MSSFFASLRFLVILLCSMGPSGFAAAVEEPDIEILIDQKIPMSDGIHLAANIYRPKVSGKRFPAVVSYTAYGVSGMHDDAMYFASHGYVYLGVNTRGRNGSEGEFFPYEDAGRDGYDLMAWIAAQPWSDGQVGMVGVSYPAFTQWQTLKYRPPALKTIIPSAPTYPGIHSPYANNILMSNRIQWGAAVSGSEMGMNIYRDNDYWYDLFYRRYQQHIPFAEFAAFAGANERWWDKWVKHPHYDDYWRSLTPDPDEYADIDIPILQISGYFDGSLLSTLRYHDEHMRYGSESAKRRHYLIIGPWTHGGTRRNHSEHDGLQLGSNSVLFPDMIEMWRQWLDWTLKGQEKPEFLESRVNYFIMNEDRWRHVETLDEISDSTVTFYLTSRDGQANDVFHSGVLASNTPGGTQRPDSYTYDPLELAPRVKPHSDLQVASLLSQAEAFADGRLIYHSQPLPQDMEIAGTPVLHAHIELDVPDTDFSWHLYEITSEGVSIELGQSILRARFRKSRSEPELVTPGKVNLYDMPMWAMTVKRIPAGSRLRLVFGPLNNPQMQKNYNSGGDVSFESDEDARTAHVKLYHDSRYPSSLLIPIHTRGQ